MKTKREAIILIPGLASTERDQQRDYLIEGLLHVSEQARVQRCGTAAVEGSTEGVCLQVNYPDNQTTTIDIYEAYWGDLVVHLSQEELKTRFLRGTTLLFYWFFSKIWKQAWGKFYLTFSLFAGTFILLAWYYGTLALLFTAIGSDPSLLEAARSTTEVTQVATESAEGLLKQVSKALGQAGAQMGGWKVWAIITLLMGFIPINVVVDIADFTRRFLKNEQVGMGPVGLRDKIRSRVRSVVASVCDADKYERITIAAHSFGTVVAIDLLADYAIPESSRMSLVTMGGSLGLLRQRAAWIGEEVERCSTSMRLATWIDFYSHGDWLCTEPPFAASPPRRVHCEITHPASFLEKLMGKTHDRYFGHQAVVHTLLNADGQEASRA